MPISALTLAPCAFFAQASSEAVQFAAAHMRMVNLRRREVLRENGDGFFGLGVVLQGRMQAMDLTLDGREAALLTAEEHSAFGHAGLLAAQPIAMNWVAVVSPTTVAIMPPAAANELMNYPEIALAAARLLGQQVCDFLGWQRIQAIHPISARVCAWLNHLCETSPALSLPTHAELAWRLNTTRESVTRIIQRLVADRVLSRDGDVWIVEQPETLRALARGENR